MTDVPAFPLYIAAFLLLLGPLVFIHEFGHYAAGRLFGVKAEEFAIGFGREIAGVTDRRGTRWKFCWLPLGGYVRFAGDMNPASQPTAEWLALPPGERNRTFQAKPLWQRAVIVAAGPAINLALAVLILAGFALAYGESRTPAVAGGIAPGSAAAAAGLAAGDRIAAIDGNAVARFDDLRSFAALHPGARATLSVERDGVVRQVPLTVGAEERADNFGNRYRIGLIGIAPPPPVWEPVSLLRAPVVGVTRVGDIIGVMVETLRQIVVGDRSVRELGGPIKIAQVSGEQLRLGWPEFTALVALISINLGFINLLPVPVLDGGHLMFYAIEAIRRRPASPQAMEWAYRGGLMAILALMLLVTINDLGSVGLWRGLAGLIG